MKLAIDLNAVPPVGIAGIDPPDKAKPLDGILAYGALGVGGLKMKIHKAAIRRLFESNDAILDAEEVFALGGRLLNEARASFDNGRTSKRPESPKHPTRFK